jgi:DNA repair protein RecO (recombination protein O)
MLVKTKGIIIRSVKYGESSLIFDAYTEEYGLCSFIVGGVRKKKASSPPSLFQLMSWVDMVVYFKNQQHLNRVKETRPLFHYRNIPFDIKKRSLGLFMVEIIQKSIKETEHNSSMFHFIEKSFRLLDETEKPIRNFHIGFLLHLSGYLGFRPHGNWGPEKPYLDLLNGYFVDSPHPVYTLSKDTSQRLSECLHCTFDQLTTLSTSRQERKDIVQSLITFYSLHLERFKEINTYKILSEILE